MLFCEYYKIFKNTYFEEYLWTAASRKRILALDGLIKLNRNLNSNFEFWNRRRTICKLSNWLMKLLVRGNNNIVKEQFEIQIKVNFKFNFKFISKLWAKFEYWDLGHSQYCTLLDKSDCIRFVSMY